LAKYPFGCKRESFLFFSTNIAGIGDKLFLVIFFSKLKKNPKIVGVLAIAVANILSLS